MKKQLKDVSASVKQRLLNHAKETGRPFEDLFHYYAMERFLYRLSESKHWEKVILKGMAIKLMHGRRFRKTDSSPRFTVGRGGGVKIKVPYKSPFSEFKRNHLFFTPPSLPFVRQGEEPLLNLFPCINFMAMVYNLDSRFRGNDG